MSGDLNCVTIDRQRMRTLALLDSERIKLQALQQQFQASDEESASIYQELIEEQEQTIENLEQEVQTLTDRLEGPVLRERLIKVEAALKQANAEMLQLKRKAHHLETEINSKTAQLKALSNQFKNLADLNKNYIQQIALLSLHERQNAEDHASTVLTVSNRLAELDLNIPAKASLSLPECPTNEALANEELASDPRIDQTIFSTSFRVESKTFTLSLVISCITANLEAPPIELKLTELDREQHSHRTQTLRGFATPEATLAAEVYAETYQKLQAGSPVGVAV